MGSLDGGLLTPEARAELDDGRVRLLRERLGALSLPVSIVASMELLGRSEDRGQRIYRYALADLTATDVFTLRLAPDGKIAGLDITPRRPPD
jgi:hypothetical protein